MGVRHAHFVHGGLTPPSMGTLTQQTVEARLDGAGFAAHAIQQPRPRCVPLLPALRALRPVLLPAARPLRAPPLAQRVLPLALAALPVRALPLPLRLLALRSLVLRLPLRLLALLRLRATPVAP